MLDQTNKISSSFEAEMSIVTLNVGGELFTTTESTLGRSEFLSMMLEAKIPTFKVDGHFFLDMDPNYFRHTLNIMRGHLDVNDLTADDKVGVTKMLDYLLIPYDLSDVPHKLGMSHPFHAHLIVNQFGFLPKGTVISKIRTGSTVYGSSTGSIKFVSDTGVFEIPMSGSFTAIYADGLTLDDDYDISTTAFGYIDVYYKKPIYSS